VVQEIQVSTVNFDLSTGVAAAGGINVVTRSGGKDLHGTAFYFFRDHKLAAYPALDRDAANPDPFFQRRQFGFALGGPIRRDRVFFFGNWERNEQRGVIDTNLAGADFAHFSRVTPSPLFGDQFSLRLDGRISNAHTAFLRYSHDGSRAVGPITFASNTIGPANGYPSTWARQLAWADQSVLGVTSVLRATLVNDLRRVHRERAGFGEESHQPCVVHPRNWFHPELRRRQDRAKLAPLDLGADPFGARRNFDGRTHPPALEFQ